MTLTMSQIDWLYKAVMVANPDLFRGKWTWKIHEVREAPGWGWLVQMAPSAPGVPEDQLPLIGNTPYQLPLIGNTPYLVRPDGSARSTWPDEFARFYPENRFSVEEHEDDGRTVEQIEAENQAKMRARSMSSFDPTPDPGPGPLVRVVPRGAPLGRYSRVMPTCPGGVG